MLNLKTYISAALLLVVCAACNNNKPAPTSEDITKTAVTVNGKKDSVSNNPQKNYGNATLAEPCVKCIIRVVQHTDNYKASVMSKTATGFKYIVNWAEGAQPADSSGKHSTTNAIKLDVIEKADSTNKIASFIYDNTTSRLFFVDNGNNVEVKVDKTDLKEIRQKCFWGVASHK